MVSNSGAYKEMRYWPLSFSSVEENRESTHEMSVELTRPTSQRKDTKDSGYGESFSECEEDLQHLPDWCRQFLGTNIDSSSFKSDIGRCNFHKESSDEDDNLGGEDIISGNNNSDNGRVSEDTKSVGEKSCSWRKMDDDDDKESLEVGGARQVSTNRGKVSQPHQRQRRITPVPLSSPMKLSLRSSPGCLFVEEEDTEDIKIFNLEDEFVDQGFWQSTSSPRHSPHFQHRSFKSNSTTELHKMEGDSNQIDENPTYTRSFSEAASLKQSPETSRRHRHELLKRKPGIMADDRKHIGKAMQFQRLFTRSHSEPDVCFRFKGIPKDENVGNSKIQNLKKSEEKAEEKTIDSVNKGGKSSMSLKDTPRIKLESAESLPDWMREAEAEDDASNEALENIGEQDSKIKEKLCVRLRNDGAPTDEASQCFIDRTEITDEIVKIYSPQKNYEGRMPRRNRKLTPARPTSPSLEKLVDLQDQVCAFSVAEQDSD